MRSGDIPDGFTEYFRNYMSAYAEGELADLANGILARYPANSPEAPMIAEHLKEHVRALYHAIGDADFGNRNREEPTK